MKKRFESSVGDKVSSFIFLPLSVHKRVPSAYGAKRGPLGDISDVKTESEIGIKNDVQNLAVSMN